MRGHESMGLNESSVGVDDSLNYIDAHHTWIQWIRVLLHGCFDYILPRVVEHMFRRPNLHFFCSLNG